MKNKTVTIVLIVVLAILAVYIISVLGRAPKPEVGENGRVQGAYSLESVMRLGKPYRCTFNLSGENSQVAGTIFTDSKSAYGEFRLLTSSVEKPFSSFLILRDDKAYVWTSLYPLGYETKAASSASRNASPTEQAQIIGLKDKLPMDCSPWQNPDQTVFDTPSWVTFSKI